MLAAQEKNEQGAPRIMNQSRGGGAVLRGEEEASGTFLFSFYTSAGEEASGAFLCRRVCCSGGLVSGPPPFRRGKSIEPEINGLLLFLFAGGALQVPTPP